MVREKITKSIWRISKKVSFTNFRFFSISDGKYLVYTEKLGEKPKGIVPLEGSKVLPDDDKSTFKLILPDREFILKTPSTEEKTKWMTKLQILIDAINQSKTGLSKQDDEEIRKTSNTVVSKKQWKIENMDKEAYKVFGNIY